MKQSKSFYDIVCNIKCDILGRSMGSLPLFGKCFFFDFFFTQYAGMVQKTLLVKKNWVLPIKNFEIEVIF